MTKRSIFKSQFQMKKFLTKIMKMDQNWVSSTKYYSQQLLFRIIVLAALEQTSIEEIVEYLQFRIDFFPSAETVLNRLYKDYQKLTLEQVEFLIGQNLQNVAKEFSFFQGSRKLKCTIAIDLHDEPYYEKN